MYNEIVLPPQAVQRTLNNAFLERGGTPSKSADIIQKIVDSVPPAKTYHTDGYYGYTGIDFCGQLKQNYLNKNDTHLIESTNSDLRHYISGLHRRSRIFYRSLETFRAVLSVFIETKIQKTNHNPLRFALFSLRLACHVLE
jgi:IS1 family transposase